MYICILIKLSILFVIIYILKRGFSNRLRYYLRSETYQNIVERELIGTHPAALVHSAVLVDLRVKESEKLTFLRELIDTSTGETYPIDDIIIFARSAQKANIDQFVTNRKVRRKSK